MVTRRDFLRLGLLALALSPGLQLQAAEKRTEPKRRTLYTRQVRRVTGGIQVVPRRWSNIILHHSGLRRGNAASYDREHRKRGMENGLAYHFVIGNGVDSKDGQIEIGRRWLKQLPGGHVRSEALNANSIGICLVGDFQKTRPTVNQIAALRELIEYLKYELLDRKVRLMSHAEAHPGHTVCPGRYFPMRRLRQLYG